MLHAGVILCHPFSGIRSRILVHGRDLRIEQCLPLGLVWVARHGLARLLCALHRGSSITLTFVMLATSTAMMRGAAPSAHMLYAVLYCSAVCAGQCAPEPVPLRSPQPCPPVKRKSGQKAPIFCQKQFKIA